MSRAEEIYAMKVDMMKKGWRVEELLTGDEYLRSNQTGYSIWLKRWIWHGKTTISITGHDVVFHKYTNDANDIDAVYECVKSVCEIADKAYNDFPDSIPYQNARGEIVKDIEYIPFCNGKDVSKRDD